MALTESSVLPSYVAAQSTPDGTLHALAGRRLETTPGAEEDGSGPYLFQTFTPADTAALRGVFAAMGARWAPVSDYHPGEIVAAGRAAAARVEARPEAGWTPNRDGARDMPYGPPVYRASETPLTLPDLRRLAVLDAAVQYSQRARWISHEGAEQTREAVVRGFVTEQGHTWREGDVREARLHLSGTREHFLPVYQVLRLMEAGWFHLDPRH